MALYHYSYKHSFLEGNKGRGGGSNLVPGTNFKDIPASRIGKKNLKYFFLCIRFQGNLDRGFHGSHIFYGANIASGRFIN